MDNRNQSVPDLLRELADKIEEEEFLLSNRQIPYSYKALVYIRSKMEIPGDYTDASRVVYCDDFNEEDLYTSLDFIVGITQKPEESYLH